MTHQVEIPFLLALHAHYQPLEALDKPLLHDTLSSSLRVSYDSDHPAYPARNVEVRLKWNSRLEHPAVVLDEVVVDGG